VRFERAHTDEPEKDVLPRSPAQSEGGHADAQRVLVDELDVRCVPCWVVEEDPGEAVDDAAEEEDDCGDTVCAEPVSLYYSFSHLLYSLAIEKLIPMPKQRAQEEHSHDNMHAVKHLVSPSPEGREGCSEEDQQGAERHESRDIHLVDLERECESVLPIRADTGCDRVHERHVHEVEGRALVKDLEFLVGHAGED
jgi:hypothetical protein